MKTAMRIEAYTPRWQAKVSALAERIFGAGYFRSASELPQATDSCFLVCISPDEEVTGFVYGRVLPQGGLQEFLEQKIKDIPEDLMVADAQGALGVVQSVAVAAEFRAKGIGTKLLRAVHDGIVGLGADKLIVTFKRGPVEASVDAIMGRLGFEQWAKLPTYFKESCDQGAFICIHRHNGCTCEAILYRKAVY